MARPKGSARARSASVSEASKQAPGVSVDELEERVHEGGAGLKSLEALIERSKLEWKVETERTAARHALRRCFTRILERGELKPVHGADEAEEAARQWLESMFEVHLEDLVDWMWNDASTNPERVAALRTAIWFAAREHMRKEEDVSDDGKPLPLAFNFNIVLSIVEGGVCRPLTAQDLVVRALREEYIQVYVDFQWYYAKALQAVFNTYRKTKRENDDGFSIESAFLLLCLAPLPRLQPLKDEVVPALIEGDEALQLKLRKVGPLRNAFQNAWLSFLRLRSLRGDTFKAVLTKLPSVIPYMSQPLLLSDFLTASFSVPVNTSGDEEEIPILAISAIFILIRDYGLDYPGFYDRLYELLRPSLFLNEKRQSFCLLLDAALKSSHIPAYIVAAFCKKLARVALLSSPSAAMFALAEVYNLLRRHPNCVFLIHRVEGKSKTKGQLLNRDKKEEDAKNLEEIKEASRRLALGLSAKSSKGGMEDPYNFDERDPAKSKANESSLWEVETLKHHYCPSVASLARSIFAHDLAKDRLTKPELPLQDFVLSYTDLYKQEARLRAGQTEDGGKRVKVDAPLNMKKPTVDCLSNHGLFAS